MPRNPDLPCADCGKLMWRGKGVLPPGEARCRACRRANRLTILAPIQHGTPLGRDGHRRRGEPPCEPCREAWNKACREQQAAARARGWERPDRPKANAQCLGCGEVVTGAYRKDRPYHRACRERVEQAERKRLRAAKRLAAAAAGTASEWVWVAGECAQCLAPFARHGRASRFCSKKCRQKARRSWKVATRDRLAIYERDEWTCQICLELVDRDLMATDPLNDWAPSLDHVVPQARGGSHDPENLRLAHRWCNAVRGDESYYTEADLQAA